MIDYKEGDDITCVETHIDNICKEDNVYVALKLSTLCDCGPLVDIGAKSVTNRPFVQCATCNKLYTNTGIHWLRANRFRGLDTLVNIDSLTEIIKETEPFTV